MTGRVIPPARREGREGVLHLDYGLLHIPKLLNAYGRSVAEFGLPQLVLDWQEEGGNRSPGKWGDGGRVEL